MQRRRRVKEQQTRKEDIQALLLQALGLAREGKLALAVERCREATSRDPDSARAHAELAHFLLEQGEVDDASHHIEVAIGMNTMPPDPQLLTDLGRISASRGLLRRASEAFREALKLDPAFHAASDGLIAVTDQMN